MLEIRFHTKKLEFHAEPTYSHLPAYWIVMTCHCSDCKSLRKKLKCNKDGKVGASWGACSLEGRGEAH